jgi:hypothetical protein
MNSYLISISETGIALIGADDLQAAIDFARNYFGDYRVDYRNHNRVGLLDFVEKDNIFRFQVERNFRFRRAGI